MSVFNLVHAEARERALQAVRQAPEGWQVRVVPQGRVAAQNALLHAILQEIAINRFWAGKKRDMETWKRLLVAAWCRTRGEAVEILPALDGHGVDIVPQRTSKLSKSECADLIEFISAWNATNHT